MGSKIENRVILDRENNEHTYMVTQLAAKSALKLKVRLAKVLSAGLGGLGALMKDETKADAKVAPGAKTKALEAIERILTTVDVDEVVGLMENILGNGLVVRDGVKLDKTLTPFTGDLMEMYKAAAFVLEVNFADFFGVLKKLNPISEPEPQPTAPTE